MNDDVTLIHVAWFSMFKRPVAFCSDCAKRKVPLAQWFDNLGKRAVQTFTFEEVEAMEHDLYRRCRGCRVEFVTRSVTPTPWRATVEEIVREEKPGWDVWGVTE